MYMIRGKVMKLLKTATAATHSGCSRRVVISIETPGREHVFDLGYTDEATKIVRMIDDYNRKMWFFDIHMILPAGTTDIYEFCGSSIGLQVMVKDLKDERSATIERIVNRGEAC
jgi:hypothetical protein